MDWSEVRSRQQQTLGYYIRDSEAISASRKRPTTYQQNRPAIAQEIDIPGIIYVSDRNAPSICPTALAFFVTKSPYMFRYFGDIARASDVLSDACLKACISTLVAL